MRQYDSGGAYRRTLDMDPSFQRARYDLALVFDDGTKMMR
jgi:hypothetical protein